MWDKIVKFHDMSSIEQIILLQNLYVVMRNDIATSAKYSSSYDDYIKQHAPFYALNFNELQQLKQDLSKLTSSEEYLALDIHEKNQCNIMRTHCIDLIRHNQAAIKLEQFHLMLDEYKRSNAIDDIQEAIFQLESYLSDHNEHYILQLDNFANAFIELQKSNLEFDHLSRATWPEMLRKVDLLFSAEHLCKKLAIPLLNTDSKQSIQQRLISCQKVLHACATDSSDPSISELLQQLDLILPSDSRSIFSFWRSQSPSNNEATNDIELTEISRSNTPGSDNSR